MSPIAYGQDFPDPFAGDDLLAGVRNGAWLDGQDFPPLRYAIPGVIPEGLTLNVGAPKIGKSWLVLTFALAKASGGIALNSIRVEPSPVLYLALEDGDRRMQSRCRILLEGEPIPAALDYLTRVDAGRVIETIAAWLARHPGEAPFVILDTLGKVMPPAVTGESAYQRDYRIASALKQLADAEPGSSVLINHHDRKASADDFIDSVSGTHGLAGAADTTIVLVRGRNDSAGLIKITGRDVPEGEYAVRFERGSTWQLDGHDLDDAARTARTRAATARLGDRAADIIAFVAEHPEGVKAPDVEAELGINDARRYLARLADADRIVRLTRGLYGPTPTRVPSVPLSQQETAETLDLGQRDAWDTPLAGVSGLRS